MDLGMNERAAQIADAMTEDARALRVDVTTLDNGARVIDAGVSAPGGLAAGRRLAETCMGGLGQVSFTVLQFDDMWLPGLTVTTDHPHDRADRL